MKMPNGFGSVYKLSGRRRRPWAARKTRGWNDKGHPVYDFIGYYATRQEALTALVEYNQDPYDLTAHALTFAEVYAKWSPDHFAKVSQSNVNGCRAAFKLCEAIHDMPIRDIKLDHLQALVDNSGKNTPTLRKLKVLLGLVFDYAVKREIITADRRDLVKYVDISGAGNPNALNRKPFSDEELKKLWSMSEDDSMGIVLMMVYSGVRVGELLELRKEDVHLDERWFFVRASKTEAGIREVPIAECIVPMMLKWMNRPGDTLLTTPDGKPMTYRNYYDTYWIKPMEAVGMDHKPHDTRHTCISQMARAKVDERLIKAIVGHRGQGVTQTVYTHLELPEKLEAVNSIPFWK